MGRMGLLEQLLRGIIPRVRLSTLVNLPNKPVSLWTVEGNQCDWRKPTHTQGEHVNSTQKEAPPPQKLEI